jgi:hypothetical protein
MIHRPGLEPVYANLVRISHSPSELVLDFARILPGEIKAPVLSKVLLSPISAKLFLHALTENIAKYESTFGEIKIPQKTTLADQLFRAPIPPDSKPGNEPSEE